MAKRLNKTLSASLALSMAVGFSATEAQALTNLGSFSGNDCGAGGFANCYATQTGVFTGSPTPAGGSPVIGKFEYNNGQFSAFEAGAFNSVLGSEFTKSLTGGILSFTYTPTGSDPVMRYFSIKQANGYTLFYDAAGITSAAIKLSDIGYNSISHVTFFDTGSGTGGDGGAVPEPATWAMMLLGFAVIGIAMRRRREVSQVRFAF